MKKIIILFLIVFLYCINISAQSAFQKTVARYANISSVTANVTMVHHNKALTKNKTSKGNLWMKKNNKLCISVNNGKDKLIMNGSTFIMKHNGRKFTTSSKTNKQFVTFKKVLDNILNGGKIDIDNIQGVNVKQNGNIFLVTIYPAAKDVTQQKRMTFTSFVMEINSKTSALESLRMNEKRGGYTIYTFTNTKFNQNFADTVFIP